MARHRYGFLILEHPVVGCLLLLLAIIVGIWLAALAAVVAVLAVVAKLAVMLVSRQRRAKASHVR